MLSYHNDPAVKAKYQARFEAHRKADEVIQGQGFNNGTGCFVGCTLDKYEHNRFPIELGWPEWLAYLVDRIFEGLPEDEAPQFGTDILQVVPIGVDLELAKKPFLLKLNRRNLERLNDNNEPYAQQTKEAIQQTIAVIENKYFTEVELESAWFAARSAESAARSAESAAESAWFAARSAESAARSAESAAESAADSAARSAADSAARSAAESAARSAAESAARSAAESAARSAVRFSAKITEVRLQRDELLEILRGLK